HAPDPDAHGDGALPAATRTVPEAVPRPPLYTARIDQAGGVVHVRGRVDAFGADLLCRSVGALQQMGHRRIVVHLAPGTTVDDEARARLDQLGGWLAALGVELLIG